MRSASGKRILTFKLTREHAEAIDQMLSGRVLAEKDYRTWRNAIEGAGQAFNAQLKRQKAR